MNCHEWRRFGRDRRPRCELCGTALAAGDAYFELPDGFRVCGEGDCLRQWAGAYRRLVQTEEEEDG
ncbi:MAG: hypothetical protein K6G17_05125 [Oscillospiraceae bacterium]|nr:hypothetical protein [Oscillospiraceae bacterium]